MRAPTRVGAFIRDHRNRVYVQRRAPNWLLPGTWDVVGGHLEPGETPEAAVAREIAEETGWRLRRIEAVIGEWTWAHDGVVRRELDHLVEVDGDLGAPRLEPGTHDAWAWVGPDNLERLLEGRADGDRRLRDLVAKAVRIRLTERLRLEPIGPEHADDLLGLHHAEEVAAWYGRWTPEQAHREAARMRQAWETEGVHKWIAYDRTTGELVGRGGLSRQEVDGRQRLEAGWIVRPQLWGRGYATEIGHAALVFALNDLGAEQVVAFTEPHNQRSRAVMRRLGMRYAHQFVRDGIPFVLYTL